jgi:hypothetical protein
LSSKQTCVARRPTIEWWETPPQITISGATTSRPGELELGQLARVLPMGDRLDDSLRDKTIMLKAMMSLRGPFQHLWSSGLSVVAEGRRSNQHV